ncbi:uncharacterized protein METZ01_LOCUS341180, partial [marine metagenome]
VNRRDGVLRISPSAPRSAHKTGACRFSGLSIVVHYYNRRCHAADVERYGVDFRPGLFGRGCYVIAVNLEGPLELLRNSRSRRTRKACPHRLAATQCTDSSNDQRWRAKRVSGYSERQW